MRFPPRGPHAGVSAVEVVVGAMVAGLLGVVVMSTLFQSRDAEQRSRLQYLALLAARDQVYRARFMIGAGAIRSAVERTNFTRLEGDPLADIAGVSDVPINTVSPYYPGQKRIAYKLVLETPAAGERISLGTVTARWVDGAGDGQAPAAARERPATLQLTFGVLKPPGAP